MLNQILVVWVLLVVFVLCKCNEMCVLCSGVSQSVAAVVYDSIVFDVSQLLY